MAVTTVFSLTRNYECASGLWCTAWSQERPMCFESKLSASLASVRSLRSLLQSLWSRPSVTGNTVFFSLHACILIIFNKYCFKYCIRMKYEINLRTFFWETEQQYKLKRNEKMSHEIGFFKLMLSEFHFILSRKGKWIWYVLKTVPFLQYLLTFPFLFTLTFAQKHIFSVAPWILLLWKINSIPSKVNVC